MSVTVQASKHPLKPDWVHAEVEPNQSIYEIAGTDSVIALLNGREVAPELHRLVRAKDNTHLVLWPIPQDDENRDDAADAVTDGIDSVVEEVTEAVGSDIVRAIATIGIAIAAPYAATAMGLSKGTLLFKAAVAGISMAGQMAVNALIPPQMPDMPSYDSESFNRLESLTGVTNRLAAFQPIPRLYGTFKIFPPIPMTARPYSEVLGEDQYIRMLVCLGYGPLEIGGVTVGPGRPIIDENTSLSGVPVRIGETAINELEDVQFEIGNPDQMTLYTDQIIEDSTGFTTGFTDEDELDENGVKVENISAIRTTQPDADSASIDFGGRLYSVNDEGKTRNAKVFWKIEFREVGTTAFTVAKEEFVISSSKKETVREGLTINFPSRGQYDIRVTRLRTEHSATNAIANNFSWSALRTIRSVQAFDVENTIVMSLRMKATNQLNGRVDDLSIEATSVIPVYNGSQWVEQPTNNPAWIYADIWTGTANRRPLPKSDLDTDALTEWANFCDTEGFKYNGVFDAGGTTLTRASEVASAGLASWAFSPDSKVTIVRDTAQTLPKMVISPRNSYGFSFELVNVDVPEGLRVRFIDGNTYQNTERLVFDDGFDESNATEFETLEAKGVTDPDQAFKYARFHIAQQRLRPERYTFNQDVQHLRYKRGDLLTIQYDTILVGIASGRIKNVQSDTVIELDEVVVDNGEDYAVKIQHKDGTISTVGATPNPGATNKTLTLDSATPNAEEDDLVIFGISGKESIDVKVSAIEPQGELAASVTCVPAAPNVLDALTGSIPQFDPVITDFVDANRVSPKQPSIESIESDEGVLYADDDGSLRVRMLVETALGSFPGWDQKTQLRYRAVGDSSFDTLEPVSASTQSIFSVDEGVEYEVQVRGVKGGFFSPWSSSVLHTVTGKSNPPPDVTVFSATQNGINVDFDWDSVVAPDLDGYVIRFGGANDTFDSASKLLSTGLLSTEATTQLPAGTYKFFIKAEDTTENLSAGAAEQTLVVQPPNNVSNFTAEQNGIRVNFNWSPVNFFGLDGYEVRIGSEGDTWQTSEKLVDVGALSTSGFELVEPGQYRFFIKAYSSLGDESEQATTFDLTVEPPGQVQNFNAIQNGETVVFRWQQVDFFGLKGYEIRFGDAETVTYVSGSKLVEANQSTAIAQADVPPGNYKFMIKAISDLDSESEEPAERILQVKTDYIDRERTVHHPAWIDGWYRGFEKQGDVLLVEDDFEAFYVTDQVDLLFDAEGVRAWAVLEAAFTDSDSTVDKGLITSGITQFEDYNGIDAAVSETIDNGALQIGLPLSNPFVFQEIASRNTGELWQDDNRTIERNGRITDSVLQTESRGTVSEQANEFESYDTLMGWQEWTKGEIDARFVKYRARIKQREGEQTTKLLRKFTTVVDVEERIERQQNKAVAIGGTTFSFDRTFHFLPAVVATVESDDALFPIRKNLNTNEVTFVVRDSSGNDVGTDNLDFIATGA